MLLRILIGAAIAVLGYLMVSKTQFFLDALGRLEWAEKNLGGGGSRFFYKILGTLVILLGFLVITNLFNMVIGGFIISIFGRGGAY